MQLALPRSGVVEKQQRTKFRSMMPQRIDERSSWTSAWCEYFMMKSLTTRDKTSIQPLIRIKLLNHRKFLLPLHKEISTTIYRNSYHSPIIEILSPQMMRSFGHQLSRGSLHSPESTAPSNPNERAQTKFHHSWNIYFLYTTPFHLSCPAI